MDVDEFVEEFLRHDYDPIKRRIYYLKNRVLKGRKKPKANSHSNVGKKSTADRTDNAYAAKAKYLKAKQEVQRVEGMYDRMRADYKKVPLTDVKKQWKYGKIEDKIQKALEKAKKNFDKADKEYEQAFNAAPEKSRRSRDGEYFVPKSAKKSGTRTSRSVGARVTNHK